MPRNDRDPSGQLLKILNMESKSFKKHDIDKLIFLVSLVLGGIGWYWMMLDGIGWYWMVSDGIEWY